MDPSRPGRALRVFVTLALVLFGALALGGRPASGALGTISGKVWNDANNNAVLDAGEMGYFGGYVYLDLDHDAVLDGNEPVVLTDSVGDYLFPNVALGSYAVTAVLPNGFGATGSNPVTVNVADGANVTGVDVGISSTAAISGVVFDDVDGDGVKDVGEAGVTNKTVYLDLNGNLSYSAGEPSVLTDPTGQYTFTNLAPGVHRPRLTAPSGTVQTSANFSPISIAAGKTAANTDFALFTYGTITGTVFNDLNANASKDVGDSGLSTKTVYLDADNDGVKDVGELTASTNSSGVYTIASVPRGVQHVRLVVPAGSQQTTADPPDVNVFSGTAATGVDFGWFTLGSISGTVFNDLNASGVLNVGEAGVGGKTLYVDVNDNGSLDVGELNVNTNASGVYTFTNLPPGGYRVRLVVPATWTQTSPDPLVITSTSGLTATSVNFGLFAAATISGLVFDDTNGNGVLNAGEPGFTTATVFLDDDADGVLDLGELSTTSGANGNYTFTGLAPGTYRPRMVRPANTVQTTTNPVPSTPGSGSTTTANFGVFRDVTISGAIFDDIDGDGQKDAGEAGVSGRTVFLDANSNGTFDVGEASAVSAPNGAWTVSGLSVGTYRPRLVVPSGMTQTTPAPGAITATSGMVSSGTNFGLFVNAGIAGFVFSDFDGDGLRTLGEPGLAGRVVFLDNNSDGAITSGEPTATSDGAGNYLFSGLAPGTYRVRVQVPGGSVRTSTLPPNIITTSGSTTGGIEFGLFVSAGISGTVYVDGNGNGTREGGDAGIVGRTVYLDTNANGALDVGEQSTTTVTGGGYTFTNLGPGTYAPKVVVPLGSVQTSVDPVPVVTTSGSVSTTNNFGLFAFGSITGTVYNDVNGNAAKNTGEAGIGGRTVFLDGDADGALDPGEVTATTNASGIFTFTGLMAGDYDVRPVVPANTMRTTTDPPTATVVSGATVANNDFGLFTYAVVTGTIYDDANGNGTKNLPGDAGIAGANVFLDLNSNSTPDPLEPTAVTDSAGVYTFITLGPGSYRPRVVVPSTAIVTTSTLPLVNATSALVSNNNDLGIFTFGVISGVVFDDANGNGAFDTDESPSANQRVYSDNNGSNTFTTGEPSVLTDANGMFALTGLKAGAYKPRVVIPTGITTSTAVPATATVNSGTTVSGVKFGLFTPGRITGIVFNDVNGNGVRDTGDAGQSGKTVYIDADGDGVKDATETSVVTAATGSYTLASLNAGTYTVRVVPGATAVLTTTNPAPIAIVSAAAIANIDFGTRSATAPAPTTPTTPTGPTTPTTPETPETPAVSGPNDAMSANTGYWMASANGGVYPFGAAESFGSAIDAHPVEPIVGLAATSTNKGYYLVARDGGIFAFGDATFFGSMGGHALNKPMVGMATTPSGKGYWTVASDGGIFAYGDAAFFGSTGSITLNQPIVAMQPTASGKGYWLVASDGGIFAFGDARFFGSTGAMKLNKPVVGMARAANDAGYWLVASDGGIFAFGVAPFYGSTGAAPLNKPIVSMRAPASGDGYWMFASDGGVFSFGSAKFFGGTPAASAPIVD